MYNFTEVQVSRVIIVLFYFILFLLLVKPELL